MRSHCRTICRFSLAVLLGSLCFSTSGCQIGRSFFQMSSDAPVPFFGMNLLPKRESKSPTDGVSRFQNEAVAESASEEETPLVTAQSDASRSWGSLLNRSPKNESLELPTTSMRDDPPTAADAPVEQFD